jgi:RHS repeat-associated protein
MSPGRVTADADGSLYISEVSGRVRRITPDGIITTVAGTGQFGFSGDGGPATQAQLNQPGGVSIARDGSLYIADRLNSRVRRVTPDGIISTVAGTGVGSFGGDGGPAIEARLSQPVDVAVGPDGSLYIADGNHRVRRVGTDGTITTVAGNGQVGLPGGDNGPATQARLGAGLLGVAVGADDNLYISASGRVRRVTPDGIITTFAGNGAGSHGDGGPATQAGMGAIGVADGPDGSIYISDQANNRIRRVGADGIISTVAGNGLSGFSGDGAPATQAAMSPVDVAVGPDGSLYIADGNRVRRVGPALPGITNAEMSVASENGTALHVFSSSGRHLRTLHALTGATLYEFTYDSSGQLTSVVDGDGNKTTIERDGSGNPMSIVGSFGHRSTLTLDSSGYLASVVNPAGEAYQFAYSSDGLLTTMTDPRGKTSSYDYDSFGRLTDARDAAGGHKTLARRDAAGGHIVTFKSDLGRTTTYETERLSTGGTRRVSIGPDGGKTQVDVGTDGRTTTALADGTSVVLLEGPDPRWGMQAPVPTTRTMKTPGGRTQVTSTARNAVLGNNLHPLSLTTLTEKVTVNGRSSSRVYDAASRTFTVNSAAGRTRVTTIDSQGRVIREQAAGLEAIVYTYDPRGRLERITQAARVTALTYNADGHLASVTDPLNRTVMYSYDLAGRVTQQTLPGNRVVSFAYDKSGNQTGVSPPGRTAHEFAYTNVNLQQKYDPPAVPGLAGDETINEYDSDRALTRVALPTGQSIELTYDPTTGQLRSLKLPRGAANYGYDSAGRLTSLAAPDGPALTFGYDGALLTGETWTGNIAGVVGRTFDNDLRPNGIAVNGSNVALSYDNDGLLTGVGPLTLNRSAENGLLTDTTLGITTDAWTYNALGEPASYTARQGPSALFQSSFTRDELGRIVRKVETLDGATTSYDYRYDAAGRLDEVRQNGVAAASYSYDANGNRFSVLTSGDTINGTYDEQDRLIQYGGTIFTYSPDGRLRSKSDSNGTTAYAYDEFDNLLRVEQPDGTSIEYLVDGKNRRVGKKVNGVLVQGFLYQSQVEPVAELDGAGNVVSRFIYASRGHVPDYMVRNGITYRIASDHLGSPRLVIDSATGTVVQRLDYDSWGNVLQDTNPGFQPFGFAGGLHDRDTRFARFGARDYDPQTGRWTAKDPVLFSGGDTNLYAYVWSDPINITDPFGLDGAVADAIDWWEAEAQYQAEQGNMGSALWRQGVAEYTRLWKVLNPWVELGDVVTDPCMSADQLAGAIAEVGADYFLKWARGAKRGYEYYKFKYGASIDPRSRNVLAREFNELLRNSAGITARADDFLDAAQEWMRELP